MGRRTAATPFRSCLFVRWSRMAQPISTPHEVISAIRPSRRAAQLMVVAGAGFGAAVLLGALVLWFHYGTAVFFEMLASGIGACF
jgi:hypothetical protein